jgi:hypothetical protein
MTELHKVLHSFPGYFRTILIELLEGSKSYEEILDYMSRLKMRLGPKHRDKITEENLKKNIASALDQHVLVQRQGGYSLTRGGNLNFAIMCQAVDSRNHFLTSLLVCLGIVLSMVAHSFKADWAGWLLYGDGISSVVIGLLILKSAIELTVELVKPEGEPTHVSHFVGKAQEKIKSRVIFDWLCSQLEKRPLTEKQLEQWFIEHFCEKTPKILILSGVGYRPDSADDLHRYLRLFLERKRLILLDDVYRISAKP